MTGDELAIAVVATQGYFIVGSDLDQIPGDLIDPKRHAEHNFPTRVVATSNREEYLGQLAIARKIAPSLVGPGKYPWKNYYRVEAAD